MEDSRGVTVQEGRIDSGKEKGPTTKKSFESRTSNFYQFFNKCFRMILFRDKIKIDITMDAVE